MADPEKDTGDTAEAKTTPVKKGAAKKTAAKKAPAKKAAAKKAPAKKAPAKQAAAAPAPAVQAAAEPAAAPAPAPQPVKPAPAKPAAAAPVQARRREKPSALLSIGFLLSLVIALGFMAAAFITWQGKGSSGAEPAAPVTGAVQNEGLKPVPAEQLEQIRKTFSE